MRSRHLMVFAIFSLMLVGSVFSVEIKRVTRPPQQQGHLQRTSHSTEQFPAFIQVLDKLFQLNQIHNNNQYQECFTQQELMTLDGKVSQLLDLGRQLQENSIQNYPNVIKEYLTKNFEGKTIACFVGSNDIKRLLFNYGIKSIYQALEAFETYSYQRFSQLHQIFLTLIQRLKEKDIEELTSYSNKSLTKIFTSNLTPTDFDTWGISTIDPQLDLYKYYGITASNGLIGAVSQKYPFQLSKTVLAGAYDKYGRGRVDNIVETMNVMDMELFVNGVKFPSFLSLNFKQYIDFKKAEFQGSYSIGNKASVSYNYKTLKNAPTVFYLQTTVTAHDDITIQANNHHNIPDYLNDIQKQFQSLPSREVYRVLLTKATTKSNKIDIVLSSAFFVDDESKKYLFGENFAHEDWDSQSHLLKMYNVKVPKGGIFKFYLVSSLISSEHHSDPKNEATRLLLKVASTLPSQVHNQHYALWQQLWQSDIIIEGNNYDQRIVRSMVYHFYSFINEYKAYGLSPMGLSGLGYNGHVFWDMDLWMYPAILALKPRLAKSLIEYRVQRLQAARNNAFLNGYKGAMYPWESSKTGDEQCPIWAAPGPLEHHITGTVAVAAWKYYCVTKDLQWLKTKGRLIIQGAAEFWQSRVQIDANGTYHINNVVAADQWAENIDDDAFTNAIAIESLRIANKMRYILNQAQNPTWTHIQKNIVIHKFPETNITKEYSTYNGSNIKQADVNLLAYPLKMITDPKQVLNDLQYYEKRVPVQGTPAMTHAIFSLLYSRLGNASKAYSVFEYSFGNNMLKPFSVMAQTQFGTNPYFLTGAGGVLQAVIFGFAGVDITDNGITKVQSVIPEEWDRVVIKSPVVNVANIVKDLKYDNQQKVKQKLIVK